MITTLDARAWPDLVFPLSRHDLGVDAAALDAGVQACFEVRFYNLATERDVGAGGAVVGSLRSGKTDLHSGSSKSAGRRLGPPEGVSILKEGVFLFDSEPGLSSEVLVKDLHRGSSGIGGDDLSLRSVAVAEHQKVRVSAKGVLEDGSGLQDNLRVLTGRLFRGRTIKVPLGKLGGVHGSNGLREHFGL